MIIMCVCAVTKLEEEKEELKAKERKLEEEKEKLKAKEKELEKEKKELKEEKKELKEEEKKLERKIEELKQAGDNEVQDLLWISGWYLLLFMFYTLAKSFIFVFLVGHCKIYDFFFNVTSNTTITFMYKYS